MGRVPRYQYHCEKCNFTLPNRGYQGTRVCPRCNQNLSKWCTRCNSNTSQNIQFLKYSEKCPDCAPTRKTSSTQSPKQTGKSATPILTSNVESPQQVTLTHSEWVKLVEEETEIPDFDLSALDSKDSISTIQTVQVQPTQLNISQNTSQNIVTVNSLDLTELVNNLKKLTVSNVALSNQLKQVQNEILVLKNENSLLKNVIEKTQKENEELKKEIVALKNQQSTNQPSKKRKMGWNIFSCCFEDSTNVDSLLDLVTDHEANGSSSLL